jgi:hypothetical protein
MVGKFAGRERVLRRAALGFAVAASAVSFSGRALADQADMLGRYDRDARVHESPQDAAVEIRFGRYVPDADRGVSGTPYKDTFGSGNRFYAGIEADWQLLRIPYLGTLGPGFGIGYTKSSAYARTAVGMTPTGESTSLEILPMYLVGVLRADVLTRETSVPLVPYAKLGVGYALWRASNGEHTPSVGGVVGRGHSYGFHGALGLMLLLDAFSAADARTADANLGLNHSYVFGEWFLSRLDGFGNGDQLNVGTSTWTVGLAFEF